MVENVRTKCIIFGEALRIRGKKFKQNLAETYSKSNKIAITSCKFSKLFRGSMPLDPPRAFFVSQSVLNLFCRKNALEKCGKSWPSPFEISHYATGSSRPQQLFIDSHSTPWMVQLTPGGRYRPLCEPLAQAFINDHRLVCLAGAYLGGH